MGLVLHEYNNTVEIIKDAMDKIWSGFGCLLIPIIIHSLEWDSPANAGESHVSLTDVM